MGFRISLRQIEEIKAGPEAFKQQLLAPPVRRFNYSRYQALCCGAARYHKTGNSDSAIAHFNRIYQKNFSSRTSQNEYPVYLSQLNTYVREFEKLDVRSVRTRVRLGVSLPLQFEGLIACGAEVSRVELNASDYSYSVWLFSKDGEFSRDELRLPVLQEAFGGFFQAPVGEVSVGFYDFSSGQYTSFKYSEMEIAAAKSEVVQLLTQLI